MAPTSSRPRPSTSWPSSSSSSSRLLQARRRATKGGWQCHNETKELFASAIVLMENMGVGGGGHFPFDV